jgi:glycosyltransferase involved in cell wall biosynthesis
VQDVREIEVIVVVDGPDDATSRALGAICDPRLKVLVLPQNCGLGEARNAGVAEARGDWIALLDDDDEWLEGKLAAQLAVARGSRYARPIVSCRFIARTKHGDVVLPRRAPGSGETVSEYLFCQKGLLGGEGLILPSTMLAPRELVRRVPFRFERLAHEGSDWILRATRIDGVGIEFVPSGEPLAIWHGAPAPGKLTTTSDWRTSLAWAESNSELLTRRAHASFILIRASLEARRARDIAAFWRLPCEAFRRGRPTAAALAAHALIWLVPESVRFRIAALVIRT